MKYKKYEVKTQEQNLSKKRKPEDLCAHTESGKNMELQSVWDEKSRTVLLSYRSNNEKVHITGKLKYES